MTTELIDITEYCRDISMIIKRAKLENISFIVTDHGEPIDIHRPL